MHRPHRLPYAALAQYFFSPDSIRQLFVLIILIGTMAAPVLANEQMKSLKADHWVMHPALQPFELSGKDLPSDLFFVRTRGELPKESGVVVHGSHKGVFLVSGDPSTIRGLAKRGCAVIMLKEIPPIPPAANQYWKWIDTPDPDIAAMVAEVDWPGVLDKIEWLADFDTRYSFAPNHSDVAESIAEAFEAHGLQTTLRSFDFYGTTMWNVEAIQTGTLYPNSFVIVCGHFDSISENPMIAAPGADDNATGTAMVMTAAEILSQHEFEYSIRYVCFAGEELGLVGSYYYAAWARQNNLDLVGVLNFDMLGYWEPGADKDLEIETNQASQWLAHAVVNAADLYTDTPYEVHVYDWAWWGDHFWFWLQGYPALNHEEAWDWGDPDFNPYYHTINDLPQYLDPDFTVGNVKLGVAALATLASAEPPQPVTFDMRPGSCPNPLNPKSHGVFPALLLGSADFDVRELLVSSLRLEDFVSPVTIRIADMGSSNHGSGHPCADPSPDGYMDLSLKFSTAEIAAVLGSVNKGDIIPLRLRGRLADGTVIEGIDAVGIVGGNEALLSAQTYPDPPTGTETPAQPPTNPQIFALYQNVPNPFNPTTRIRFDVPPEGGAITLRIYDVGGRLVRTLVNGAQTPGPKAITWDGLNDSGNPVATGTYLYRMTGPGFERTRKMVILK